MNRKIRLLIGDVDKEYINSLLGYITDNFSECFTVAAVGDPQRLERLMDAGYRAEILVTTADFLKTLNIKTEEDIFSKTDGILLLDSTYKSCTSLQGFKGLIMETKKYQDVELIVHSIRTIYEESQKYERPEKSVRKAGSIGIYSPLGGCGRTFLSVLIAKFFASSKYKVLLQSFEDISSLEFYFTQLNMEDFQTGDFYLSLATGTGDIEDRIKESIVTNEDLDILLPGGAVSDACQLGIEEVKNMLRIEKEKLRYQYIVSDFGAWSAIDIVSILETQDLVIIPLVFSKIALYKLSCWVNFIKALNQGEYESFIKKWVCVCFNDPMGEALTELKSHGFADVICSQDLTNANEEGRREFLMNVLK